MIPQILPSIYGIEPCLSPGISNVSDMSGIKMKVKKIENENEIRNQNPFFFNLQDKIH